MQQSHEKLQEHLSKQVEDYDNENNSLMYFKSELTKISSNLENPLIFIIDELDRCRPEFSIRLIERIKHFFDIRNVVFILSVNQKQLEESIDNFYGFKSKNSYLDKFIDLNIKLVNSKNLDYSNSIKKIENELGFQVWNSRDFNFLCEIFNPNARQLNKLMQKIAFLDLRNYAQSAYSCLYLFAHDLKLLENKSDENELIKLFFLKAKNYYVIKNLGKIKLDDPKVDYRILEQIDLYNDDGITLLASYYNSVYIEKNSVYELEHKHKLMPDGNHGVENLILAWDNYIHNGFVINSNN